MPREAKIKIGVTGGGKVRAALQGTTNETRTAEQKQRSEAKQTEQTAKQAERSKARAAKQAAREISREWRKAERERRKEIGRTTREAERASRAQTRAATRAARDQKRARSGLVSGAVGAAAGAVVGVAGLARRGQATAGVGTLEERIGRAGRFEEELVRQGTAAGVEGPELGQIRERVLKAAEATNVDPLEIAQGLGQAQARFDAFRAFADNIDNIARAAKATGSDVGSLVGTLGTAQKAFNLSGDDLGEFLDVLIGAAARGNIEAEQFAASFAPTLAAISRATGRTGIAGAREAIALAEVAGTGQTTAPEAATFVERFLDSLARKGVQKDLRRIGVETTQEGSDQLRPLNDILTDLSRSEKFQKSAIAQEIFTDIRSRRGAQILSGAVRKDADIFTNLENIRREEGAAIQDKTVKALVDSSIGQLQNVGIKAQTATIRDADRIVDAYRDSVGALTELQTEFPLLTASLDALNTPVIGLIGGIAAGKVFGLGAGAEGAAGAAALGGKAGKVAGALGAAGKVVGTGALGFAIGDLLRQGIESIGGVGFEDAGKELFDLLNPEKAEGLTRREASRSLAEQTKGGQRATPVELSEKTIDALANKTAQAQQRGGMTGKDARRTPGGPAERR